jgi:hypothetical protein
MISNSDSDWGLRPSTLKQPYSAMRIFCLILIACLPAAAQQPKPAAKVPHFRYVCDMYNDPVQVEHVVDGKVQPPEDHDNWNVRCTVQIDNKVVSDERLQLPEFASFAEASAAVTTYQKNELPRILEDHGLPRVSRSREKTGDVPERTSWQ